MLWTIDGKLVVYAEASKRPDGKFYIGVFNGFNGFNKEVQVKTIQEAELIAITKAAKRKNAGRFGAEIRTSSLVAAQEYRKNPTKPNVNIVVIKQHCESDFGNRMAHSFAEHSKKKPDKLHLNF